jgi:uncharacterized protein (DUF885 family)
MRPNKVFRTTSLAGSFLPLNIASLILACLMLALAAGSLVQAQAPDIGSHPAAGNDGFRAQVAQFVEAEMRLYPERATALGDHRFDNRVDDLSAGGAQDVVEHAKKWLKVFGDDDPKILSAENEADREWLVARINEEILWTEEIKTYERDPGIYFPTAGINGLIKREFAPVEVRMRSVTAREIAALRNLDAARTNLKPAMTPKVLIEIELEQLPATIAFFNKDVPQAFAKVAEGADKTRFAEGNRHVVAAIEAYGKWLKEKLMPSASGNYAIGADAYRKMLDDADMVDTPLEQLEAAGERELARLQHELEITAHQIDPKHTPAEVIASLGRVHPAADEVLTTVAAGLNEIRDYVVAHHLATIPSEVPPMVRETPPYMRATTFASMDTPGPFEKSTEAFFYVTLPEPSWSDQKKEQLLAFYAPATISDTSVHEVYPGHYVQFQNNRLIPDVVRQIYHSGADSEGWALYCEQMMLDEGLHAGEPKYRIAQLQMALMRACRYLVGIRMHTRGMTVKEAAKFFEAHAYQTPHNAMVEARRGTNDPGYLRYQLGKLMILKLRADVQKKQGAAFNLGKFHDAFLKQGAVPIKLIRRAMLGVDGPLL